MRTPPILALAGAAFLSLAAPVSAEKVGAEDVPLDAPVVILGEQHDISQHHLNQALWVARLEPAALVFEMLPPGLGPAATRLKDAPEADLEAALDWTGRGWSNFSDYYEVFRAAGEARIYGAEVSRHRIARAVERGAGAAMGRAGDRFGLGDPLAPEEQAERAADQGRAHCGALPEAMLAGMVEAQRLRDAALADAVLTALDATGGPVAVITGNGHARRDWGVPRLLARARPQIDVIAIGQFVDEVDGPPFDAWVISGARDLDAGDSCDALRQRSAVVLDQRAA